MTERTGSPGKQAGRPTADRRVRLGFLAVLIALGAGVYFLLQRGKTVLKSWPADLDTVLSQARAEDRKVVAIFLSSPPSEMTRRMAATTLRKPHNQRAIAEGRFLRVKVTLPTSLKSALARRYKIRKLPTTLVLDPGGRELNRREGMIGEVPFREEFLSCTNVVKPPE